MSCFMFSQTVHRILYVISGAVDRMSIEINHVLSGRLQEDKNKGQF